MLKENPPHNYLLISELSKKILNNTVADIHLIAHLLLSLTTNETLEVFLLYIAKRKV